MAHNSADRAAILFKIADRMEQTELLATAETWDNGNPFAKPALTLAIDHFRYLPRIRAQEGIRTDSETVAYHFQGAARRGGADYPWNFPLLMAS